MTAQIIIISGFLGAGKTTFIQKYLQEAQQKEKIVLIENDFGEISVDAAVLQATDVAVKEIKAGCICCSLVGDFVASIQEIIERFQPDKIVIEPSGVSKLSDIIKACEDESLQNQVQVQVKATVADVEYCEIYLDNFGEFYEDQLLHADVIVLSRTDICPEEVEPACQRIRAINPQARIETKPWSVLDCEEVLALRTDHHHCGCAGHDRDCHCHVHGQHTAEEAFDTITIRTEHCFTALEVQDIFSQLAQNSMGVVLRAKGIIKTPEGYKQLQYVPGHLEMVDCAAKQGVVCVIGQQLQEEHLLSLFQGEPWQESGV